ncbi:enkurin [Amphiprion ocellaris]|uniref:Enkurin domain-containing protein n=2 Tax=Amphiprion TaxID=80969 RepID=A0A3Q1AZX1_AMPOC|nr:enkurin [Amphiprion ocellaris]
MSEVKYPPESIYNILPKEESRIEKQPRYMSKFRPAVVQESRLTKDAMRTMGPAKVEMPSTDKYLKKHSKESKPLGATECSKDAHKTCTCTEKKPPVPARTDNPLMGIHTKRDFIKTATAVPKKPQPICVDTSKGHKQPLENSGLVPKYIKKTDYGKIPTYLQQRNDEKLRAEEEYNRFVKDQREQGALRRLPDEERLAVLENLKKDWDKLHHEYQSLPLFIETMSQKAHKVRLEEEMKQLEKDISLFERFKTIYVSKH